MLIGQDHTPTGVITGVRCATHRIDIDVNLGADDNSLRHAIYVQTAEKNDDVYTTGGISLKQFLDQCSSMAVVPCVSLNFGVNIWNVQGRPDLWKNKYSLEQFKRLAKLTAEIICSQYNFKEKYLQVLNEPLKWLSPEETGYYTRKVNEGLGNFRKALPIVIGNEEWDLSAAKGNAFEYWCIHFAQDFDYIGAHPLSSVRNNLNAIKIWSDMGKKYNKPVMATESGSWNLAYTSPEGHLKNKQIILECKKYGYKLCNIVLIDCNDSYFPRLGYRGWDKYYTKVVSLPKLPGSDKSYFDDFMEFVKEQSGSSGQDIQNSKGGILMLEKYYYKGKVTFNRDPKKAGVKFIQDCLNLKIDGDFGPATDSAVKAYQEISGLTKDGIAGPSTFMALKSEHPCKFTDLIYKVAIGEW